MSLEIVKEVKETEVEADTIKKEASAKAKQIIQDSKEASAAILEKARAEAKVKSQETLQKADASVEEEEAIRRKQIEAQGKALADLASAKMDKAAELIVERIVRG